MTTETKKKRSILQIFSSIIVYFITIGYIFENHSQRTVKLTKTLIYLQRLNLIFFIFKKFTIFIKFYIYKFILKFIILFINLIFNFIKISGISNISFGYSFNFLRLKFLLKDIRNKIFQIQFLNIRIGFRLFLLLRLILLLIFSFFRSLRITQTLFQWFFIKYLVKRKWIKGDTTLIDIPHFVLHNYFLQFIIDLIFGTIEHIYCIFKKKRFSRGFHNYFFICFAFIHISIYIFCLKYALTGKYIKNLPFFSEAIMLNLGNSPDKEDSDAPKIPNNYLVPEKDLIDKNI